MNGKPRRLRQAICLLFVCLVLPVVMEVFGSLGMTVAAQEREDTKAAIHGFLEAFNALDMPEFIAYFAEDATIFHPPFNGPETFPTRLQGRREIQRSFQMVFDEFRKNSGRAGPPYIDIRPEDLLIQSFDDYAIASFHLGNESNRARRTVVLRRVNSEWKIVHLHASAFNTEDDMPTLDSSFIE